MNQEIVLSSLTRNYSELETLSNKAKSTSLRRIEVDICDGAFVPSASWPLTEISKNEFLAIGKTDKGDYFLPNWESINYTAHLMVEDPVNYIDSIARYGFDRATFHFGTFNEEQYGQIKEKCSIYEIQIYLAYKKGDSLEDFISFVKKNFESIAGLQVMTISKVGFQGQDFREDMLDTVAEIREKFPEINICVDGSVNDETIGICAEAGANEFVVGSFLSKSSDFKESLRDLHNVL